MNIRTQGRGHRREAGIKRTDSTFRWYNASMSSHIGAVKGWWVLLHLPLAKKSLSSSPRVNNGNSVIHKKWGSLLTMKSPVQRDQQSVIVMTVKFEGPYRVPVTTLTTGVLIFPMRWNRPVKVDYIVYRESVMTYIWPFWPTWQPYIVPKSQFQLLVYVRKIDRSIWCWMK